MSYVDEIIGDLQYKFWCYRATDQIFYICHTGEEVRVHQLFTDCQKACDSVRKEVLYNILIELGMPMKLVRLIKMFLN
jgi:hypothetical protein